MRGYESEDERRCMSEREYAGCKHGLLATRTLPYPPYGTRRHLTLPFKGHRK